MNRVEGMDGINGKEHEIEVEDPFSFRIGETRCFEGAYSRNGVFKQVGRK